MDRNDRIAVIGTWHHPPRRPDTHPARAHDPRGWSTHHRTYRAEHGHVLSPAELIDAIEHRAHEIWERRMRTGTPGTAIDDWLAAEHEIMRRQAEISGGQGPHPAIPA